MTGTPNDFLVTEIIIEPGDKRNSSELFHKAKRAEILGILERRTWTVVDVKSLTPNSNVISGRFANASMNVGAEKETAKPRYVSQGYKGKLKPFVAHNTPTLRQTSSKIIVSCASF